MIFSTKVCVANALAPSCRPSDQLIVAVALLRTVLGGSVIILLRRSSSENRTSILSPVKNARPNGTEVMLATSAALVAAGIQNHSIIIPAMPPSRLVRRNLLTA
jgi:hypothetical protein